MVHALLPGCSTMQLATNHSEASRSKVPPGNSGLNRQYVAPASHNPGVIHLASPSTPALAAAHNCRGVKSAANPECTQHFLTGLIFKEGRTYEPRKEDVLGSLDGQVGWTPVP